MHKALILLTLAVALTGCDDKPCLKSHELPSCMCVSSGNNMCVPITLHSTICDEYKEDNESVSIIQKN